MLFMLDTCPEVEMLDHRSRICSALIDAVIRFSKAVLPTYSPSVGYESAICFIVLPYSVGLFILAHCDFYIFLLT